MNKVKYDFSTHGIKAMYNDSLEEIFSALADENENFTIEDLDIKITIGNREIKIPIAADIFELLFESLSKMHDDLKEMGEIE